MKLFEYKTNTITRQQIKDHLTRNTNQFTPPLHSYVDIDAYSEKLFTKAEKIECWCDKKIVGLLAYYFDTVNAVGFISNFSVDQDFQDLGIGHQLLNRLDKNLAEQKIKTIRLKVYSQNVQSVNYYKKNGYFVIKEENSIFWMEKINE